MGQRIEKNSDLERVLNKTIKHLNKDSEAGALISKDSTRTYTSEKTTKDKSKDGKVIKNNITLDKAMEITAKKLLNGGQKTKITIRKNPTRSFIVSEKK